MPATGPGDKPNRPRRVRRQPKPPTAAQVQQAAQNARPLSARPVRPKPVPRPVSQRQARQTQQRAQNARPLSSRPVRPKQVVRPLASKPPRRVTTAQPSTLDVHTDVRTAQRQAAVHVYDQLSHHEKRARVAEARQKVKAGNAGVADHAILHIHDTRVAGKQKQVAAAKAFEALDPLSRPENLAHPGVETVPAFRRAVRIPTGGRLTPPDSGGVQRILDAKGKEVGRTSPYKKAATGQTVADLPGVGKVVATVGPLATKGLERTSLPKVIKNIPKDAGELAVTSPTAAVKSLSTLAAHPKQGVKALAKPYQDLAKHPGRFIEDKPVTAALMLNPLARTPGRILGKGLRVAGKQTLQRDAAILPGTALREARTGSRAAGRRAVQAVKDKRAARRGEKPVVTARQVDQRVDEAFVSAQKHGARVRAAIGSAAKEEAKKVPKAERKDVMEQARVVASAAAKSQAQVRHAREFGATAHYDANGRIVEPATATEGHLHATQEEARAVADHLNAKNLTIPKGHGNVLSGDPVGRLYAKEQVPVTFTVRKVGDATAPKYAVIPERVASRLDHHQSVGSTQARGAKILRLSRSMFTRAVLPYRPSWLSGQGIEGVVRSAVKGAGPTSYLRGKRYVKALERQQPGSGKAFLERASPTGIVGSHQFETPRTTFREEFPGSNVARALTDLGRTPGIKQVRELNRHVTDFVFNRVNAKFLEGVPQTAMLGKVLKDSPLMERKVIGLSNKAMDQAARGGVDIHTAVDLYRELQKSYGKYEAFSPHIRELISHWTPFLPWYLNTAKFLLSTLPKDHPLATALIADMDAATEDWRRRQGLSFRHKENRVPGFMLGGYPVSGDSVVGKALGLKKGETHILRIGHYTPAGIGSDVLGATSGLPLPQFSGFYNAMLGLDWKNQPLKHENGRPFSDSEKFVYGLAQLAEAMIPLSGQVTSVTGVPGVAAAAPDKGEALKKLVRPISTVERKKRPTGGATPVQVTPVKVRPVRVRPVNVSGG